MSTHAHDDTAPGYIFLAPEKGAARQGGSMIVDDRGEVVWFRPLRGRYDGRAHDLKVQSYRGKSVLTWMEGVANEYVIAEHTYREIARISAGCSPFTHQWAKSSRAPSWHRSSSGAS